MVVEVAVKPFRSRLRPALMHLLLLLLLLLNLPMPLGALVGGVCMRMRIFMLKEGGWSAG